MKRKYFFFSFLLFIFCSFNLLAENFPQKASKIEDFIPKGWKSIVKKEGDLNNDNIKDVVLVIQKDDPDNAVPLFNAYEALIDIIDANQMIILVLFKDKNSQFNLVAKNEKDFIISAGKAMEEMAKMEMFISHNFDEDLSKAISIENDTLHIFTAIRNNYGDLNLSEYVFKYKNNKFELVSLKSFSEEIHSSYETKYSFFLNFLTKKVKIETLVVDSKTNKNLTDNKKEKTLNITEKYILDDLTGTTKSKIIKKYVYNK
ncbi:hypothetical protein [Fusobacterium pseudoperiodonticum]|uniref:hypothetical protein n=1 Tax=Fusobacterium pseudoperiodonticum TaxID=2663009 RepID=UPI000C1B008C|nr:hypothetical protein [Fusobacterium pseudoperiodonticum]PIM77308.1 hypothetical protein CTM69_10900 [Fusobacterium pseudoperiodonticum]